MGTKRKVSNDEKSLVKKKKKLLEINLETQKDDKSLKKKSKKKKLKSLKSDADDNGVIDEKMNEKDQLKPEIKVNEALNEPEENCSAEKSNISSENVAENLDGKHLTKKKKKKSFKVISSNDNSTPEIFSSSEKNKSNNQKDEKEVNKIKKKGKPKRKKKKNTSPSVEIENGNTEDLVKDRKNKVKSNLNEVSVVNDEKVEETIKSKKKKKKKSIKKSENHDDEENTKLEKIDVLAEDLKNGNSDKVSNKKKRKKNVEPSQGSDKTVLKKKKKKKSNVNAVDKILESNVDSKKLQSKPASTENDKPSSSDLGKHQKTLLIEI